MLLFYIKPFNSSTSVHPTASKLNSNNLVTSRLTHCSRVQYRQQGHRLFVPLLKALAPTIPTSPAHSIFYKFNFNHCIIKFQRILYKFYSDNLTIARSYHSSQDLHLHFSAPAYQSARESPTSIYIILSSPYCSQNQLQIQYTPPSAS